MTNNLYKGAALTEGQTQQNSANNTKTFEKPVYFAKLTANNELSIKASYKLEIISTDLTVTIGNIYRISQVNDLIASHGLSKDMVYIVGYERLETIYSRPMSIARVMLHVYINLPENVAVDVLSDCAGITTNSDILARNMAKKAKSLKTENKKLIKAISEKLRKDDK